MMDSLFDYMIYASKRKLVWLGGSGSKLLFANFSALYSISVGYEFGYGAIYNHRLPHLHSFRLGLALQSRCSRSFRCGDC